MLRKRIEMNANKFDWFIMRKTLFPDPVCATPKFTAAADNETC